MKVFVTGVAGQLGHDVMNELVRRGHEGIGSDLSPTYSGAADGTAITHMPYYSLDITDAHAVSEAFRLYRPDALIHCAAWTAVDAAEDPANREKVMAINAGGTSHLAHACLENGTKMMYISTDYVFDGTGEAPWQPDCREYAPLNVYGQSKLQGELEVSKLLNQYFIVRIAWVFGSCGSNFVKTMLHLGKTRDRLHVVCDQIGTPTYTYDLARLLTDMIETDRFGYYHATNEGGYISWYDFAEEIFHQAQMLGHSEYSAPRLLVSPVSTAEYGNAQAARPHNSRLDKTKLTKNGFTPLPTWQDAISRYIKSYINFDEF